ERLHRSHVAQVRRDRGRHDRRSCGRLRHGPDQDRRAGAERPCGEVQPAAPHRGGARGAREISRVGGVSQVLEMIRRGNLQARSALVTPPLFRFVDRRYAAPRTQPKTGAPGAQKRGGESPPSQKPELAEEGGLPPPRGNQRPGPRPPPPAAPPKASARSSTQAWMRPGSTS